MKKGNSVCQKSPFTRRIASTAKKVLEIAFQNRILQHKTVLNNMSNLTLGVGTRLQHTQHGPGVIVGVRYATYLVSFIHVGL